MYQSMCDEMPVRAIQSVTGTLRHTQWMLTPTWMKLSNWKERASEGHFNADSQLSLSLSSISRFLHGHGQADATDDALHW